jgi:hypothetical protein
MSEENSSEVLLRLARARAHENQAPLRSYLDSLEAEVAAIPTWKHPLRFARWCWTNIPTELAVFDASTVIVVVAALATALTVGNPFGHIAVAGSITLFALGLTAYVLGAKVKRLHQSIAINRARLAEPEETSHIIQSYLHANSGSLTVRRCECMSAELPEALEALSIAVGGEFSAQTSALLEDIVKTLYGRMAKLNEVVATLNDWHQRACCGLEHWDDMNQEARDLWSKAALRVLSLNEKSGQLFDEHLRAHGYLFADTLAALVVDERWTAIVETVLGPNPLFPKRNQNDMPCGCKIC